MKCFIVSYIHNSSTTKKQLFHDIYIHCKIQFSYVLKDRDINCSIVNVTPDQTLFLGERDAILNKN